MSQWNVARNLGVLGDLGVSSTSPHPTRDQLDGLYAHVPFCFHKCHYCDFYSLEEKPAEASNRQAGFVDCLITELELRSSQFGLRPLTIFFGGGTPTLLSPSQWQRLLGAMDHLGVLDRVVEFTVEANPETITKDLLTVLVEGGVNRISVGCQSFHPTMLKALERHHDPARLPESIQMIRAEGIQNVNLDLIYGIPGQTTMMVEVDLDTALALDSEHLSYYGLTYEPNTPLTQRLRMGQIEPIDDMQQRTMFQTIMARLESEGFEQYEISNWARTSQRSEVRGLTSSFRCRHNLLYWMNGNWLGIGPSAASHLNGHRWKNEPHLGRYLASAGEPIIVEHEHLPADRQLGERIMLGLRLREGLPWDLLDSNMAASDPRRRVIEEMIDIKMLEHTPTHLRLTREGLHVADAIIGRLI